jgi:histidyl-tRNA synthetase
VSSKSAARIKPQTLRGFRDFLPDQMIARERLIEIARSVYRSYGFAPIDTPALEYAEVLLGKGGDESDKQVFRFTDQGDRDVAMRFDLTVPLARFAAQHAQELGTPFRRYHIGPVWRGERPARGRFREFLQCDFDTIGTLSNSADIETLFVINDLLERIGFTDFSIRVNNRKVLNGLLEKCGVPDKAVGILRALDKLDKIGAGAVAHELTEVVGVNDDVARRVLEFARLRGDADQVLRQLEPVLAGCATGEQGLTDLRELFSIVARCGWPADRVALDVSIARGLDYYTGTIYETTLGELPGIGSVCSGGRYDNLAELFTAQPLPGVGASLGLDRMLAALEELGRLPRTSTPASVLITMLDAGHINDYLQLGRQLRAAGIATEVFPEAKNMGRQLKYADRRGFRLAVIAGSEEFANGTWLLKDLAGQTQESVSAGELPLRITTLLSAGRDSAR